MILALVFESTSIILAAVQYNWKEVVVVAVAVAVD